MSQRERERWLPMERHSISYQSSLSLFLSHFMFVSRRPNISLWTYIFYISSPERERETLLSWRDAHCLIPVWMAHLLFLYLLYFSCPCPRRGSLSHIDTHNDINTKEGKRWKVEKICCIWRRWWMDGDGRVLAPRDTGTRRQKEEEEGSPFVSVGGGSRRWTPSLAANQTEKTRERETG